MIYRATQKIAGGKLLRVTIESTGEGHFEKNRIQAIHITGDFFLHPEDVLPIIENAFVGLPLSPSETTQESFIENCSEIIQEILDAKKAVFVGVSPLAIASTIFSSLQL